MEETITKIDEVTARKVITPETYEVDFTLDGKIAELANLEVGITNNQTQVDYLQAEKAKVQVDIDKLILLGVKTEAEVKELENLQEEPIK